MVSHVLCVFILFFFFFLRCVQISTKGLFQIAANVFESGSCRLLQYSTGWLVHSTLRYNFGVKLYGLRLFKGSLSLFCP